MATPESWKRYPFDMRFRVSSLGRVRFEDKPPKVIKPRVSGYYYVCAYAGRKVQYAVHEMVLTSFKGLCPPLHTASHLDGDPDNNAVDNLAWETHSENCLRKKQHGSHQGGEANGSAKLTAAQVAEIRASPLGSRKLAPLYGVADAHIRRIRRGDAW
jgi:hypothetical protein